MQQIQTNLHKSQLPSVFSNLAELTQLPNQNVIRKYQLDKKIRYDSINTEKFEVDNLFQTQSQSNLINHKKKLENPLQAIQDEQDDLQIIAWPNTKPWGNDDLLKMIETKTDIMTQTQSQSQSILRNHPIQEKKN